MVASRHASRQPSDVANSRTAEAGWRDVDQECTRAPVGILAGCADSYLTNQDKGAGQRLDCTIGASHPLCAARVACSSQRDGMAKMAPGVPARPLRELSFITLPKEFGGGHQACVTSVFLRTTGTGARAGVGYARMA